MATLDHVLEAAAARKVDAITCCCSYDPGYSAELGEGKGGDGLIGEVVIFQNLVTDVMVSPALLATDAELTRTTKPAAAVPNDNSVPYLRIKRLIKPKPFEQALEEAKRNQTANDWARNPVEVVSTETVFDVVVAKPDASLSEVAVDATQIFSERIKHFKPRDVDNLSVLPSTILEVPALPLPENGPVFVSGLPSKCDRCGRSCNLWLNLNDGYVGCGRKLYGQEETTGCTNKREGAALDHYSEFPDRSITVKLDTLDSTRAECYCYKRDEWVKVPNLDEILRSFGIIRATLPSSADRKTMSELELEANQNLTITGGDSSDAYLRKRTSVSGKNGLIGVCNVGNSCYIGVVVQLLKRVYRCLPEDRHAFAVKAVPRSAAICKAAGNFAQRGESRCYSADDVNYHLSALITALISERSGLRSEGESSSLGLYERVEKDVEKRLREALPGETPVQIHRSFRVTGGFSPLNMKKRLFGAFGGCGTQEDCEEFYQWVFERIARTEDARHQPSFIRELMTITQIEKNLDSMDGGAAAAINSPALHIDFPAQFTTDENANTPIDLETMLNSWKIEDTPAGLISRGVGRFPRYMLICVRRQGLGRKYGNPISIPKAGKSIPLIEWLAVEGFPDVGAVQTGSRKFPPAILSSLKDFGFEDWQIKAAEQKMPNETNLEVIVNFIFGGGGNDDGNAGTDNQMNGSSVPKGVESGSYNLVGVITHVGRQLDCGHYVVSLYEGGRWNYYNDDEVFEIADGLDDASFRKMVEQGYLYLFEHSPSA